MEIEKPSEKSFGIVFSIFFLLIGLYLLWQNNGIYLWTLGISILCLLLAYLAPKVLVLPNKLWFKLGILLSTIISPVIMGLIYVTTVIPTGLIIKLIGKDILHLRWDKTAKSYWIKQNKLLKSMQDQF